jgi:enediyne biosynthesis protein E4
MAPGSRRRPTRFQLHLLFCVAFSGCAPSSQPAPSAGAGNPTSIPPGEWFVDRAEEVGLNFTHFNGMSGRLYYAEIIGSGAALFDYDNDGDLDVYLAQGQMLGAGKPLMAPPGPLPLKGRLYRNDLSAGADGARHLRFTDVTDASAIRSLGYGMGAAAGDFDNDGCIDLYLTNLGSNQLFHNNCNGTFSDVSKESGTNDPSWSVSAAFVDIDRDGWLDLFVGNYLDWRVESNTPCFSPSGRPDYCSPNVYRPVPSRLYRNNRNGTFIDVTAASGIGREFGPALGVATADFNGDRWIDIYVANDGQPNQLWINQHDGTFKNTGLLSGTAMNARGKPKAGMGIDAGDVDNDGDEDLIVTNLKGEGYDLYVNDGSGLFEDQGERSGFGFGSFAYTGFGTAWIDIDNDGWLDTLVVNGAVQTIEALRAANDPFPLHQMKLLFLNLGNGRFDDVTRKAGAAFQLSEVGRGAAFGDIDNDGDVDVLVANNGGRVRLLVNEIGNRHHWVGLRFVGKMTDRDMVGARAAISRDSGLMLWRRARADGSYASANDPRVVVGLDSSSKPPRVRVIWPDGATEEWAGVPIDRYTTLKEGTGQ